MKRKGSRGDLLLRILTTVGNAARAQARHPSRSTKSFYAMLREFRELQDLSDRQLRNAARHALSLKYVVIKKGRVSGVDIAPEGRKYLGRRSMLTLTLKETKEWDGLWRIVLFDIPNAQKGRRDTFAAILKRAGFVHLQKSVFISPRPYEAEIRSVAEFLEIAEFVDVVIAKTISREEDFRKSFDL